MKLKTATSRTVMSSALAALLSLTISSCGGKSANTDRQQPDSAATAADSGNNGGPQLGMPGGDPVIDKSSDSTLQAMIKTVAPEFKQFEYKDTETGKTMTYSLFTPKGMDSSKDYPLVLFIADASTPGSDATRPLTQGYGALVWATSESQAKNPCYVLVPQFTGVAVNDKYDHTDEVDIAMRMLNSLVADKNIDSKRLYTTGQSMGGMISMYYNVAYPDVFAASLFVDCHWDTSTFDSLVKHKFIYFIAGNEGKAYKCLEPLENAARKVGVQYTFAEWNAQLPEKRQSELAATMLDKGAPVNIFEFEPKSVLPADGKGSEHMYSFDYAYRIPSVRQWLFNQSK
ncbi:MAG: alpha/beta hydrolase-fold protein [Pseudoflavonifractor sp.]|nr:alpha/beta hydrolase-fold protein [Pseudoflavonifractor sp.]